MLHELLPFTIFAFVGAFTPGPNNTIAILTGANGGFRAVLPHLLGVPAGFALMTALSGAGLGALLIAMPRWNQLLRWLGAIYLLYLAWGLAVTEARRTGGAAAFRRLNFAQSFAFQFSNPKGWAMALATVTTFAVRSPGALAAVIAIWTLAVIGSVALWAAMGQALTGLLANRLRRRAFNLIMALLLAATAIAGARP